MTPARIRYTFLALLAALTMVMSSGPVWAGAARPAAAQKGSKAPKAKSKKARSEAAKKGWQTRRMNQKAEANWSARNKDGSAKPGQKEAFMKRSVSAQNGWMTRKANQNFDAKLKKGEVKPSDRAAFVKRSVAAQRGAMTRKAQGARAAKAKSTKKVALAKTTAKPKASLEKKGAQSANKKAKDKKKAKNKKSKNSKKAAAKKGNKSKSKASAKKGNKSKSTKKGNKSKSAKKGKKSKKSKKSRKAKGPKQDPHINQDAIELAGLAQEAFLHADALAANKLKGDARKSRIEAHNMMAQAAEMQGVTYMEAGKMDQANQHFALADAHTAAAKELRPIRGLFSRMRNRLRRGGGQDVVAEQ